jgi:dynamin 1-like protein
MLNLIGYVPVINRGQRDINMEKSISQSLKKELSFFESHTAYRRMSKRCGIPYLSKTLAMVGVKKCIACSAALY